MVEIAFDSNIIIGMSRLVCAGKMKPTNKRELMFFDVMELISSGRVKPVILPTVLQEINAGSHYDDDRGSVIIYRFGKTINESGDYKYAVDKLLHDYTTLKVDGQEAILHAKLHQQGKSNRRDARIVAECVVYNKMFGDMPYVTDNTRDVYDISRINAVNKQHNMPRFNMFSLRSLKEAVAYAESKKPTM